MRVGTHIAPEKCGTSVVGLMRTWPACFVPDSPRDVANPCRADEDTPPRRRRRARTRVANPRRADEDPGVYDMPEGEYHALRTLVGLMRTGPPGGRPGPNRVANPRRADEDHRLQSAHIPRTHVANPRRADEDPRTAARR